MAKLINVQNVSFTYPGGLRPALNKVHFTIERGEHVAIVGGNGSGKSTIARHLNALLIPDDGTVEIDGQSTKDFQNIKDIRRKVGMVFQHPESQIIGATVEEDIAFGLENLAIPTNEIIHKINTILKVVDLEEYRRQPSHMLSGGQIQKLCLASVLVMSPSCVIFDEATAMLDPQSRQRIYDAISSLHDEGITVITITHDMEEAAMADRLLVMHEGSLIADQSPREFFQFGRNFDDVKLSPPPITEIANAIFQKNNLQPKTILTICEFNKIIKSLHLFSSSFSISNSNSMTDSTSIVSVQNLGYSYFPDSALERKIFDNLSMNVYEKSIHGLLGATGTGKTTLMQHLNGLIIPQKGSVKVLGKSTNDSSTNLKELRKKVGFVFQYTSHQLFENYVGDEIAFGLRAFGETNGIKDKVKEAMSIVGLDFDIFVDRQTFSLSGGERKKVALASVLVMNPEILLFDEPTVGLDPTSQKDLMTMLVRYRDEKDKTILLSSHSTNLIAEFADSATVIGKKNDAFSSNISSFFSTSDLIQDYDLNIPTSIKAKDTLISSGWNLPNSITKKSDLLNAIQEVK